MNNKTKSDYEILKIDNKVDKEMMKILDNNKDEVDIATIRPLFEGYNFGTNMLALFIGGMNSGKTFYINRHILMTQNMFKKPYYNLICYCSTSDGMDKTVKMFNKSIKTPIIYIEIDQLMNFLARHIKRKKKYYAMVEYINSNRKTVNKEFRRIVQKHNLNRLDRTMLYIKSKFEKYGNPNYPCNLLLILDDFLGVDLLETKKSPLVKLLTKVRHYNVSVIISQQSTKGIGKTVRRLATDMVLWKGIGEDDFLDLMREISITVDKHLLWNVYHSFKNKRDKLVIHSHCDIIEIQLDEK